MILKSYETKKININLNKIVLFYGQNEGFKEEEILKIQSINKDKNLIRYDEKQILDNSEIFYNDILSKSLFEKEKIIIINRATDKIVNIITDLLEKDISDISIIINSNNLEKKSKLRSLFEKNKKLICVAFYPDSQDILTKLTYNFFEIYFRELVKLNICFSCNLFIKFFIKIDFFISFFFFFII